MSGRKPGGPGSWDLYRAAAWLPRWRSLREGGWRGFFRAAVMAGVLLFFVSLMEAILRAVFTYVCSQEKVGLLLLDKLVGLLFLALLVLLVFSNLVASLSGLFLSDDGEFLLSSPLPPRRYFRMKFWQSALGASWSLLFLWVPVLVALSRTPLDSAGFLAWGLVVPLPFCLFASCLACLLTLAAVRWFPARRLRQSLVVLGVLFLGGVLFLVRMMQSEQVTAPERAVEVSRYLASLSVPQPWWLPSTWASRSLTAFSAPGGGAFRAWALLWAMALGAWALLSWAGDAWFWPAWLASRDRAEARERGAGPDLLGRLWSRARGPAASLILKDAALVARQGVQRMQTVFLALLVAVYLYNIAKLPMQGLESMVSFIFLLSCVLSGFIVTAVALRFVFPSVSLEGEGFWLLRVAPLKAGAYLRAKYLWAAPVLLFLSLLLGLLCAWFLKPDPASAWAGLATLGLTPLVLAALSVGLGASWARFDLTSPDELATSLGGLLLMALCSLYLLAHMALLALPLREWHRLGLSPRFRPDWWMLGAPLAALVVLNAAALVWPLRSGAAALRRG